MPYQIRFVNIIMYTQILFIFQKRRRLRVYVHVGGVWLRQYARKVIVVQSKNKIRFPEQQKTFSIRVHGHQPLHSKQSCNVNVDYNVTG